MAVREDFSVLKGKTLANIENKENEELIFTTDAGDVYKLRHFQDCCESVAIEDICGDLADLLGEPLLVAEEVSYGDEKELPVVDRVRLQLEEANEVRNRSWVESETWTFYKLDTRKGGVTIRWYGESNGYYSESVDFIRVS